MTSGTMLTAERIADDLRALGLEPGGSLMVHASLSALGPVAGGAETVIDALLAVLGPEGTLVMPAFRDGVSLPGRCERAPREAIARARAALPPYNPATTPTTMGAIPEAFRQRPGAHRSAHPTTSVVAFGPRAWEVVVPHALGWAQGPGSPFERLWAWDAQLLLLGIGFNQLTMLHHAESRVPRGRRKTRLIPEAVGCLLTPDVGDDNDTHFPEIGRRAVSDGVAVSGHVGAAESHLMRAQAIVALAEAHLAAVL